MNGLNQLTTSGISHDGRGNVSAIGSASYSYDVENRLAYGHGTLYDPMGRLWAAGSSGFRYDGMHMALEIDPIYGTTQRRYVHGPGVDEPLVWYEGSGTSTRRYFHADERGSVIA